MSATNYFSLLCWASYRLAIRALHHHLDELLSNWRYRHFLRVRRMIGLRVGTGGTSGAGYLEGTLSQHYAFREITEVATFLIERSKRPVLPNALKEKVSFNL